MPSAPLVASPVPSLIGNCGVDAVLATRGKDGMSLVAGDDEALHLQAAAREVYEEEGIPTATLAERVSHVVQAACGGRRVVIFSGGAKGADEKVFEEVRGIRDGGGFGSIIGRNSFQREKEEALAFLSKAMGIYHGKD